MQLLAKRAIIQLYGPKPVMNADRWRREVRLAEGYAVWHCTVPLDLTSGSGFALAETCSIL